MEHADLHEKAKELSVLQPWEVYAEGARVRNSRTSRYPTACPGEVSENGVDALSGERMIPK